MRKLMTVLVSAILAVMAIAPAAYAVNAIEVNPQPGGGAVQIDSGLINDGVPPPEIQLHLGDGCILDPGSGKPFCRPGRP